MTLPTSGPIAFSHVNVARGAGATVTLNMGWIIANSWYNYKDLNSLRGLAYYTPVSSQNSVSRSPTSVVTNCRFDINCGNMVNTVSQCSFTHGTHLQANCNCNCTYNARYDCNCDCCDSAAACVTGDTLVTMANGDLRRIDQIVAGDMLMDSDGVSVLVGRVKVVCVGSDRPLWRINGGLNITGDHAFLTDSGLAVIEPRLRHRVTELFASAPDVQLALTQHMRSGGIAISTIERRDVPAKTKVYTPVCGEGGSGFIRLPESGMVVEYLKAE